MKCPHQCAIAAISEGSDDQPTCIRSVHIRDWVKYERKMERGEGGGGREGERGIEEGEKERGRGKGGGGKEGGERKRGGGGGEISLTFQCSRGTRTGSLQWRW